MIIILFILAFFLLSDVIYNVTMLTAHLIAWTLRLPFTLFRMLAR